MKELREGTAMKELREGTAMKGVRGGDCDERDESKGLRGERVAGRGLWGNGC